MKIELNEETARRFLKEISLCLERAGFQTEQKKDSLLAVSWNGASLCRVNANGGAQFRKEELDAEGAMDAFHKALDVTEQTVAYLRLMELALTLKARGLEGDYRLLLDFNGTVLAAYNTKSGAEFVTWEWDYDHTGMWQGHYYGANYSGAKKDFCIRAGLIPKNQFIEPEQLDELYRCCQRTRELDDTITYQDEQRIIKAQEHLESFDFVSGVQTACGYGQYLIQESGHYEYDENLEPYYDYEKCGQEQMDSEEGAFSSLGYVSYHGTLSLDELMKADPAEQKTEHRQACGPQMGGLV